MLHVDHNITNTHFRQEEKRKKNYIAYFERVKKKPRNQPNNWGLLAAFDKPEVSDLSWKILKTYTDVYNPITTNPSALIYDLVLYLNTKGNLRAK